MRLFRKPTDPAAEYIAKLNAEAKIRDETAHLRHKTQMALIKPGVGIITADKITAGTITAQTIRPFLQDPGRREKR